MTSELFRFREEASSQVITVTDLHNYSLTFSNMSKLYYVYILGSQRRVLYIGMTSGIEYRSLPTQNACIRRI